MTIVVNGFAGAETGGIEEVNTTSGTVSATTTNPRSGSYCFDVGVSSSMKPFVFGSPNPCIVGFGFLFTSLQPSASIFFECQNVGGISLGLALSNSGDIWLIDANSTTVATAGLSLVANKWYYVEVLCPNADSGTAVVRLDGQPIIRFTGDFLSDTPTSVLPAFFGPNTSGSFRYDDIINLDTVTDESDMIGPSEVLAYQSGNTTATSDVGSNLNTGVWNNTGKTPLETATTRASFTTTNVNGRVNLNNNANGGRGPGPLGGEYIVNGIIRCSEVIAKLFRGSGGGTTHSLYIGDNVDGSVPLTVTLSTSPQIFTASASGVGLNSLGDILRGRVIQCGFGTGGAQDILCDEMWGMIVHTPPMPLGGRPSGLPGQRQMQQLLSV